MNFLTFILFALLSYTLAIEDDLNQNKTSTSDLRQRKSRNYNSRYYPENDVENEDNSSDDHTRYGRPNYGPQSPAGDQNPYYYKQKRFDKFPGYGYVQPQNYYGNPWKTSPEAGQTGEVMLMMNAMDKQTSTDEDKGFLSKLTSDPQVATAIAAIIPISIILFAVLPILLSYFKQAGSSTIPLPSFSPVTTIAASRLGRALMDKEFLDTKLQDVMEFAARALEEDKCVQQTVCHQVIRRAGEKNARAVATAVGYLGKKDWLEGLGADGLFKALERGDCERVCDNSKTSWIRKREVM